MAGEDAVRLAVLCHLSSSHLFLLGLCCHSFWKFVLTRGTLKREIRREEKEESGEDTEMKQRVIVKTASIRPPSRRLHISFLGLSHLPCGSRVGNIFTFIFISSKSIYILIYLYSLDMHIYSIYLFIYFEFILYIEIQQFSADRYNSHY